jgi:hypothetical protein
VRGSDGRGRAGGAGQNIDPLHWTCCRDGENFGASVSVLYDAGEDDYILAVGAMGDGTSVTYGESYDRRNHGCARPPARPPGAATR